MCRVDRCDVWQSVSWLRNDTDRVVSRQSDRWRMADKLRFDTDWKEVLFSVSCGSQFVVRMSDRFDTDRMEVLFSVSCGSQFVVQMSDRFDTDRMEVLFFSVSCRDSWQSARRAVWSVGSLCAIHSVV